MYVSGTLKNKTIDFYREQIISFYNDSFNTIDNSLFYTGELIFTPWNKELEKKLINKEELYISKGINKSRNMFSLKKLNNHKLEDIINKIFKTNRNITYALFECFYNSILNVKNNYELDAILYKFLILINYLEQYENLTQNDLDIILKLFLDNKDYEKENILKYKESVYHLDYDSLDSKIYNTIALGEFIAPERIKAIAKDLQTEPFLSSFIAPIYFAIKSNAEAHKFLKLCRTRDLDYEKIKKNADFCDIPDNLTNMVRR